MLFGSNDRALLREILQNQRLIMTALDDVKAANAKLGTSISNAVATLAKDAAALAAAHAAPDDSADLATLASDLSAKAAALDAAVNPPAAEPAPAA